MDDDKDGKDNTTIFEKLTNAFNSVVDTAAAAAAKATEPDPKDVADNEQALIKDAAVAPEGAPPAEKNLDAPRMTTDEIAAHAAADTQTVVAANKPPKKKAATPSLSGRITPDYDFPVPDTPMPSPKKTKTGKKVVKKPAKAAKKSAKKAVKKTKAKKATKKTAPNKSKKAAKKTAKKSLKNKSKKSKR